MLHSAARRHKYIGRSGLTYKKHAMQLNMCFFLFKKSFFLSFFLFHNMETLAFVVDFVVGGAVGSPFGVMEISAQP